jgi:pimeloyl-ACP methyl ester carboxylesterase
VENEDYLLPEDATPELRAAHARFQAEVLGAWRRQSMEQFRSGVRDGRVVEMDAGHHLFLHRPGEVLQLVRDFLRQP